MKKENLEQIERKLDDLTALVKEQKNSGNKTKCDDFISRELPDGAKADIYIFDCKVRVNTKWVRPVIYAIIECGEITGYDVVKSYAGAPHRPPCRWFRDKMIEFDSLMQMQNPADYYEAVNPDKLMPMECFKKILRNWLVSKNLLEGK